MTTAPLSAPTETMDIEYPRDGANRPGAWPNLDKRFDMPDRTCAVDSCDEKHDARGFCRHHYKQWRKDGGALAPIPTVEQRFWAKVNKTETCWPWTGALGPTGYGHFGVSASRPTYAHRFSYELAHGQIPDGLEIDHRCHERGVCVESPCAHRRCVNPAHLEAVTHEENVRRGNPGIRKAPYPPAAPTCAVGHPRDEATMYVTPAGARVCRICRQARERARYRQGLKWHA